MTEYVKCRNCGGKIEGSPKKCPYCWVEDPIGKEGGAGPYIASVLVVAFLLILISALMTDDEVPAVDKKEQEAIAKAEKRREREKGFHCLSGWDGTNQAVVQYLKQRLKDPSSFEHIETRISPMDDRGAHSLVMSYRAKNSFGAYDVGAVVASLRNVNCNIETVTIN